MCRLGKKKLIEKAKKCADDQLKKVE